jgi:hypothetical protein
LKYKGISTYRFIIYKREKKEKKMQVLAGEMQMKEYKEWLRSSTPSTHYQKSKITVKLELEMDKPKEDREEFRRELKAELDSA